MSKENKSTVSQALADINVIKEAIKSETTNTLKTILEDTVRDAIREAVSDEEDDEDMVITNGEESTEDAEEKVDDSADAAEEDSAAEEADAPEADGESSADWSDASDYQVGDNAYDLTGVKDYEEVVKVFKKLNDNDEVVIRKDGDKVSLADNETGAEYVIDLGGDEASKNEPAEDGALNEAEETDDFVMDDDEFTGDDSLEIELGDDEDIAGIPNVNEGKNKKNMKNEILFEVDLGYTDNYQSKDPIKGLSNSEPSNLDTLDKGIPTGTEKPWAGKGTEKKGNPFDKSVNECGDGTMDMPAEAPMEEGTNVTLPNSRKKVKSHTPDTEKKNYPEVHHHDSVAGDYKAINESLVKENKALKKAIKTLKENIEELKGVLSETYVTNVNLGKCTKLFTENATSRAEKADIVKRFNDVKTIEESTRLYETIQAELSKRTTSPVLESKVATAKSNLNESKSSQNDPSLLRTIDLMKRVNNC